MPNDGIFEVINTTQNILILIFNASLFAFIVSRRSLRSKIPNQLFLHLQLIHIAIGVLHLISYYMEVGDYVVDNILLISMFISLLLTTVDRLLALKFPLRYKLLTSTVVKKVLLVSWLPAVCFAIIAKVDGVSGNQLNIVHTVLIGAASMVLALANTMMYVIARSHQTFVRRNSTVSSLNKKRKKNKSLKASSICLAVVLNFIVFWMPHCVHDVMEMTSHGHDDVTDDVTGVVVKQLTLCTSLTDPILFICLSSNTQKEMVKVLKACLLYTSPSPRDS